jgi:hypothetical protein
MQIVLSWMELKEMCLDLYRAKYHLSNETGIKNSKVTPDEDSDMEHVLKVLAQVVVAD